MSKPRVVKCALCDMPEEAFRSSTRRETMVGMPRRPTVRADVTRYAKPVESVFDLLGQRENDLTAALGFTLSRSPRLLGALIEEFGMTIGEDAVVVRMETADEAGRTDLEVDTGHDLVVVEAKRGWHLPSTPQLEQYAKRVNARGHGLLVTLSDCSPDWAAYVLPASVESVPVRHLPWGNVKAAISNTSRAAGGAERHWLNELTDYLRRAVRVTDPASSWAYCVSASRDKPGDGGPHTFIGYVVDEGVYFHPFGWRKGDPVDPPNFIAFRWDGKVHRIHRVVAHEVVPNLQVRWPTIPVDQDTSRPHVIYTLGPPLPMNGPLPSGTNYRASRLWVLVDQLLTCATLKEAIASTRTLTGSAADEEESA